MSAIASKVIRWVARAVFSACMHHGMAMGMLNTLPSTRESRLPSGHPERWPAGPMTAAERRLWRQLKE
jgi:hypothetical protein